MDADAPADFAPRFPGSGRLSGKVALVSGSSSGIGRAVALLFGREGARVAVTYRSDAEGAEDTARAIRADGAEAMILRLDASTRQGCFDAVAEVTGRWGRIDVLVCNAGIQTVEEDFTAIPEDRLRKVFEVNVFGYVWLIQAALPRMERGAAIVCTTSVNAYRGHPRLMDYSATKGAELALVRSLAQNLAPRGIRVNGVAPGPIWTPLIPETMPPEKVEAFGVEVPMGRPGQPNEVAPAFLFLACEDASYVTGQVIHPNGGIPVGA